MSAERFDGMNCGDVEGLMRTPTFSLGCSFFGNAIFPLRVRAEAC